MGEVDKVDVTGPNLALVEGSVGVPDENVPLQPFLVGKVISDGDAGLDYGDVLVLFYQLAHLASRELGRVRLKGDIVVEDVDVSPNGVKRKSVFLVVIDHIPEVAHVAVAPAALVHAQRPKRRNLGPAQNRVEPFDRDLRLVVADKVPEVDDTANEPVSQLVGRGGIGRYPYRHGD